MGMVTGVRSQQFIEGVVIYAMCDIRQTILATRTAVNGASEWRDQLLYRSKNSPNNNLAVKGSQREHG
jgi:hypothetical protein